MAILLVRHAEALAAKTSDASRVLSPNGREQARALGRDLVHRGLVPCRMIASTLVRAVQTAEILAATTGYAGLVEADECLGPDGDPWRAETLLRGVSGAGDLVAAVTHEPIVRVIAARLVGQPSFPPFATAGAVLIEAGRVVARFEP